MEGLEGEGLKAGGERWLWGGEEGKGRRPRAEPGGQGPALSPALPRRSPAAGGEGAPGPLGSGGASWSRCLVISAGGGLSWVSGSAHNAGEAVSALSVCLSML